MKITNLTAYPNRRVKSLLTKVAKGIEVDHINFDVIVNYLLDGEWHQAGFGTLVQPRKEEKYAHMGLVVFYQPFPEEAVVNLFIRFSDEYPLYNRPYKHKYNPKPWKISSWEEALVGVAAHEFTHIREMEYGGDPKREVETDWAEYRYWKDYVEGKL